VLRPGRQGRRNARGRRVFAQRPRCAWPVGQVSLAMPVLERRFSFGILRLPQMRPCGVPLVVRCSQPRKARRIRPCMARSFLCIGTSGFQTSGFGRKAPAAARDIDRLLLAGSVTREQETNVQVFTATTFLVNPKNRSIEEQLHGWRHLLGDSVTPPLREDSLTRWSTQLHEVVSFKLDPSRSECLTEPAGYPNTGVCSGRLAGSGPGYPEIHAAPKRALSASSAPGWSCREGRWEPVNERETRPR
jgi:hypothetical protein